MPTPTDDKLAAAIDRLSEKLSDYQVKIAEKLGEIGKELTEFKSATTTTFRNMKWAAGILIGVTVTATGWFVPKAIDKIDASIKENSSKLDRLDQAIERMKVAPANEPAKSQLAPQARTETKGDGRFKEFLFLMHPANVLRRQNLDEWGLPPDLFGAAGFDGKQMEILAFKLTDKPEWLKSGLIGIAWVPQNIIPPAPKEIGPRQFAAHIYDDTIIIPLAFNKEENAKHLDTNFMTYIMTDSHPSTRCLRSPE